MTDETDFRLITNTVRRPDAAFLATQQLKSLDIKKSPIEGAPALAIEIISPSNSAQDMLIKVHQYVNAGCKAIWVVYPIMSLVAIHESNGMREVTGSLEEEGPFGGIRFILPLAGIFDEDVAH